MKIYDKVKYYWGKIYTSIKEHLNWRLRYRAHGDGDDDRDHIHHIHHILHILRSLHTPRNLKKYK